MHRKVLAKQGEERAASFLKSKGYKILCMNFRTRLGEIDIIARDKKSICFVEVKTRKDSNFGLPKESISKRKINHISRVALYYLKKNRMLDRKARFDVVSILDDKKEQGLELIKDAFCLDQRYSY